MKICIFCGNETNEMSCYCGEYKGLMTIAEWEAYTGEKYE